MSESIQGRRDAPRFQRFVESKVMLRALSLLGWPRKKIRALYAWVVGWAETRRAEQALSAIAFAESSFFPIPPDPLLIAMVMAKPGRFLRHAFICTISSVFGGILGYGIGIALFGTVGMWIVNTYGLEEEFAAIGVRYEENAFLAVFAAAFTPIPYKLITIAAGVFRIDFIAFLFASIIGRGTRFFFVAFLVHHLGLRYKDSIEKYIDIISIGFVVVLVLGFMALKYV